MITISEISNLKLNDVLGNGFMERFNARTSTFKYSVKGGLYFLSLLVLLGYSLTLFFVDNWSKMGIVISICVLFMDAFNLILFLSGTI